MASASLTHIPAARAVRCTWPLERDATGLPPAGSPTIRRRELGALLKALRTERGWTADQVIGQLRHEISTSKLSRLETGHRGASARDINDLCDLYGVDDEQRRRVALRQTRRKRDVHLGAVFEDLMRPPRSGLRLSGHGPPRDSQCGRREHLSVVPLMRNGRPTRIAQGKLVTGVRPGPEVTLSAINGVTGRG